MDFNEEFKDLNSIPYDPEFNDITGDRINTFLLKDTNETKMLNVAFAAELLAEGALKKWFNYVNALKEGKTDKILEAKARLPEDLIRAHELQYPHQGDLCDHIIEIYNRSNIQGLDGLINGVKGKYFELKLEEMLQLEDPNSTVDILPSSNFPVIDIIWNKSDNSNIFIQAKNYAEQQASDIADVISGQPDKFTELLDSERGMQLLQDYPELQEMIDNQDITIVNYLTSEVGNKILSDYPELVDQVVVTPLSNVEITEDLKEHVLAIASAYNIDIPNIDIQFVEDFVPYVSELVLGLRLLYDLASVNKNFKLISKTEKEKIGAVKVLVLLTRYGVRAILSGLAAAAAMGAVGGPANPAAPFAGVVGGIAGLAVSSKISEIIMPNLVNILYNLMNITPEQAYYYAHKIDIDYLAIEFAKLELNS